MIFSKNVLTFIVNYTAADQYIINRVFPGENSVRIDEDSKASCEGLLTVNECLNALKTMEANKSPGSDGVPVYLDCYCLPFRECHQQLLSKGATIRDPETRHNFSFTKEGQ